ncbi:Alpha/Beta hydrolase protein [Rhypophila decipiens]|uniref:Alpha/Beta hydrolase protein n=1 Tax=Rhypophila decipiens TaxID=261697 RepID=A0AAN6Y8Y9_9PEZI|nr:Alpha/Beta hydrolase protein [Rhypophila decipiens]
MMPMIYSPAFHKGRRNLTPTVTPLRKNTVNSDEMNPLTANQAAETSQPVASENDGPNDSTRVTPPSSNPDKQVEPADDDKSTIVETVIDPAKTLTIDPLAQGKSHTHTIIFLHGRGDSAENFLSSLSRWRDSKGRTPADVFPTIRWVIPQAPPRKCYNLPMTWNQWFDVYNVKDFAEQEEVQLPGLRESVFAVRELMRKEAELLGGRWDRLVLAGISMGGATSVHTLFNLDIPPGVDGIKKLGGFMGFACRCPFAGRETLQEMREVLGLEGVPEANDDELLRNTPILMQHNANDNLVLVDKGRGLRDILRNFGASVQWKEYAEGGHWFNSPDGVDDVIEFLKYRVRADDCTSKLHRRRSTTRGVLGKFKDGFVRRVSSSGEFPTL